MKYILMILPAAAIVCGIFTGRLPEVSAAVLESASGAVTLALTLCGAMALWSGLCGCSGDWKRADAPRSSSA